MSQDAKYISLPFKARQSVTSCTRPRKSAADTIPPTTPSGLTARALGAQAVKLAWQASGDNVGVAGYSITSSDGSMYTSTGTSFSSTSAWKLLSLTSVMLPAI